MTLAVVTGAPGWLGTQLVRALVKGLPDVPDLIVGSDREVRVLVYGEPDVSELRRFSAKVTFVRGDLTEPRTLDQLLRGAAGATVFHAAGVVHATRRVQEFWAVNAEGTRNIVEAARNAGVRRFIHVSSNSPLGTNSSARDLFDESAPYRPQSNYGRSKQRAEEIVNRAGAAGDIETVVVRVPWFYGPNQPERQTRFFRMVREGRVPVVGRGENKRSMAYVDNVCQGLLLCERVQKANRQTYWIADARPYTMNEIIDTIASVLEQDYGMLVVRRRWQVPAVVSEVAGAADGLIQAAGFYVPELHVLFELNKTIACTIAKARSELGYEPRIELREGMRRSVAWLFEHGMRL